MGFTLKYLPVTEQTYEDNDVENTELTKIKIDKMDYETVINNTLYVNVVHKKI